MLNKKLFKRLQDLYGDVQVLREDTPIVANYESYTQADGTRAKRIAFPLVEKGEEYCFNCPFCHENRRRFSVSYRWGLVDPKTKRVDTSLMHCYNEDCEQNAGVRHRLWKIVYEHDLLRGVSVDEIQNNAGKKAKSNKPCDWPGAVWPLTQMLKDGHQTHEAIRYLQNRYYDPRWVAKHFHIAYCLDSRRDIIRHRIVAPLFYRGRMEFWQARYLGNAPKRVPKWYSDPNGEKSAWLYNIEEAAKYQTVVVAEGYGDVWSIGLRGVALMGKTISSRQVAMLKTHCLPGTVIAVMLDPKQDPKEIEKGRQHHLLRVAETIGQVDQFRGLVFPVWLPEAYDPGFLDRGYLWDMLCLNAKQAGIKVRRKRWQQALT